MMNKISLSLEDSYLLRWLALLMLTICMLSLANLTTPTNLVNLLLLNHQIAVLSILSFGMMAIFYAGEFDLSIGSTFALCLTLLSLLYTKLPFIGIFLVLILTVIFIGYFNAFFSQKSNSSILATLITMSLLRGLVFLLTDGSPVSQPQAQQNELLNFIGWGEIYGISFSIILLLALTVLMSIYFNLSAFGQRHKAIGISQNRARLLSINPYTYKLIAFIFVSAMSMLASLLYYARIYTVTPSAGDNYAFEALAVVIISNGGLKQVQPSIVIAVTTASIITLVEHYLSLLSFSQEETDLVIGLFVLVAILSGVLANKTPSQHD